MDEVFRHRNSNEHSIKSFSDRLLIIWLLEEIKDLSYNFDLLSKMPSILFVLCDFRPFSFAALHSSCSKPHKKATYTHVWLKCLCLNKIRIIFPLFIAYVRLFVCTCILCLREKLKHTFLTVGTLTIRDCNGNKIRWSKCKPNECSIDDLTKWITKGDIKKKKKINENNLHSQKTLMRLHVDHFMYLPGWMGKQ